MKYRKKPVIIDAIEWTGDNLFDVITFTDGHIDRNSTAAEMGWDRYCDLVAEKGFKVYTLEGKMNADIGDFIIRGIKGELYPCKPDIFADTYELKEKKSQIDILADFIMANVDGEPSQDEGAGDTAVRIIKRLLKEKCMLLRALENTDEDLWIEKAIPYIDNKLCMELREKKRQS